MANIVYDSCDIYVESATSLQDKIARLDEIINALLSSALKAALKGSVSQYSLNDGQSVFSYTNRGPEALAKDIKALMSVKNLFVQQLNGGGMVRLVDSKNFTNNGGYGR